MSNLLVNAYITLFFPFVMKILKNTEKLKEFYTEH